VSRTSQPGDAWARRAAGRRRIASPLRVGFTGSNGPGIVLRGTRSRLSVGGGTSGFALLGVSPEGIDFAVMALTLGAGVAVEALTRVPPGDRQDRVEGIRLPGTRAGHGVADAGPKPVPAD
jgi:hypothetical protein